MKQLIKIQIIVLISFLSILINISFAGASLYRHQTIHLKAGWNAIYLEVNLENNHPEDIFNNTPVYHVLSYFPNNSPVQFIQDPGELEWNKDGWHRWIKETHSGAAILNNLYEMIANQAYLVLSSDDYTLELNGESVLKTQQWEPNAYNFVGFNVDTTSPPTFTQFFSDSNAFETYQIYNLINNEWQLIKKPSTTNIVAGKAYWVYCKGGSDYQGPMEIILPGSNYDLECLAPGTTMPVEIINNSPDPLVFTLEAYNNTAGSDYVPISVMTYSDSFEKQYSTLGTYTPDKALESGKKIKLYIVVQAQKKLINDASCLLKLSDDLGDVFYIPLKANLSSNDGAE